jgi:NAD(P)-dependent dehydrogenase (short-subunit alcohol dehydrogenase family)
MRPVRTIAVTGAAGRLGRAVASWWASPGRHLVLVDRDAAKLAACRGDLASSGAEVTTITADLREIDDVLAAVNALPASLWSHPPSLVLAHAVAGRDGNSTPRLGDLRLGDWRRVLDTNLTSIVFAIQAFLPFMKTAGGGRIVLVSSAAGLSASPTAALAYSVAKAGVAALPRLLAPELAAAGVLINAVAPGKFANPDWPDDPSQTERYAASVPLKRLATADEVAALIGFLASEANTYVTGETILQDGGRLSGAPGRRQP